MHSSAGDFTALFCELVSECADLCAWNWLIAHIASIPLSTENGYDVQLANSQRNNICHALARSLNWIKCGYLLSTDNKWNKTHFGNRHHHHRLNWSNGAGRQRARIVHGSYNYLLLSQLVSRCRADVYDWINDLSRAICGNEAKTEEYAKRTTPTQRS